jgi:hypothetical protein
MTSRAVPKRDGSRVPSTARLLLGGALVLGLGATLVLVFSDDSRFLKLGIVAALWAALVGAFLAARFRRQVTDRVDNAADMQAVYELELEREIAARREYELELEAEAKRKAEEESRQDIAALRTELGALRETLQSLLGGEVLVERFALQAQATRMRSLGDEAPQLARQQQVKRLSASPATAHDQVIISAEPQTELMDRVVDRQPARRPPTQRSQRPAPREQQRPAREPERQMQVRQPQQRPLTRDERVDPADPGSGWWDPVVPPGQAPASTPNRQETYHRPVAGDPGQSLGEGLDLNWTPSWEQQQSAPQQSAPVVPQSNGRPPRPPKGGQPSQPLPRPEPETRVQNAAEAPTRVRPSVDPATRVVQPPVNDQSARRRVDERPPTLPPTPPVPPPPDAGGRRRAPEAGEQVVPGRHSEPGTQGGGRRRRPDDAPSWQDSLQDNRNTGSHAKPAPPSEPSGSHAEGKSVSELLAAYGTTDNPRRRRRRDD